MEKIFGIPMTGVMIALLVMLGLCLLAVGWVAWKRPVIFHMGMRNIPRRRAQTLLIVVGLMLSTLIIAAALGTGDTLNYSVTSVAYDVLGHVDEVVVYSQGPDGRADTALSTNIDASALATIEQAVADDPRVSGVMPILFEGVPAVNLTQGQSEPNITLSGVDPNRLEPFGGLIGVDGSPIDLAAIPIGSVVLSEKAAAKLSAVPGDSLQVFYANQPVALTVAAIAKDSVLSGVLGTGRIGMVMPLDRLQQLTGQPDVLSLIAIANAGGVRGGLQYSDTVTATLKAALTGHQLGVDPIKQSVVDDAASVGALFTSLFLLFGLFSISAGILLIILIFAMLAAERRAEMGMERAIGTQRRQLIEQFVAEGTGYTLVAGLIGSGLGILAAIGIAKGMKGLIGEDLAISPHITPRSLVVAYALGVVITFAAVVIASWRISRLNIVAAVRDLAEVSSPKRHRRTLIWGSLLLAGGTMLTISGKVAEQGFSFYTGLSLVPFGIALLLRYTGAPSRPVFSGVSIFLLVLWLTPSSVIEPVLGTFDQGMELFFLSGIFLVLGTTLLIVQNTDVLLAGLGKVAGLFRSALPAVRTAIAYPGAAIGRTGLTIAMFCLIVFALVMMGTMNNNFSNLMLGDDAAAGWDVRADRGNANPIPDFPAALQANGIQTDGITAYGIVTLPDPAARIRLPEGDWKDALVHGMNNEFIDQSTITFRQRARGYESDEAIIQALLTQPGVAVINSSAVPNPGSLGADPDAFQLNGVTWEATTFEPTTIEVTNPTQTSPTTLTIIGVIDTKIGSLSGVYANQATIDTIFPTVAATSYFMRLADQSQAPIMAKAVERALLSNGVQVVAIRDELEDFQSQGRGILYLMEGFMALGLIVGVAAVGVISFRTVVERRQQIGVLRAIGYQRGLVSLSFMIETGFIVGAGVLSGTLLGLVLARNVFTSDQWGSSSAAFLIPWNIVAIIVVTTIVAAELMAWIPARRAARIAPAEALRYE